MRWNVTNVHHTNHMHFKTSNVLLNNTVRNWISLYGPSLYSCSAYWQCWGTLTGPTVPGTNLLSISTNRCGRCYICADVLVCLDQQTQPATNDKQQTLYKLVSSQHVIMPKITLSNMFAGNLNNNKNNNNNNKKHKSICVVPWVWRSNCLLLTNILMTYN